MLHADTYDVLANKALEQARSSEFERAIDAADFIASWTDQELLGLSIRRALSKGVRACDTGDAVVAQLADMVLGITAGGLGWSGAILGGLSHTVFLGWVGYARAATSEIVLLADDLWCCLLKSHS